MMAERFMRNEWARKKGSDMRDDGQTIRGDFCFWRAFVRTAENAFWAAVLLVIVLGCEETKISTPERNLNRPTRLAFFCAGPVESGGTTISALPPELCDPSLVWCTQDDETCEEILSERTLFGLVLNTSRGELGLVNLTRGYLLDLADLQPGYGFVPVGPAPTDVQVSPDGCAAYTLNSGSCDISVVSTTQVLSFAGAETTLNATAFPATSRLPIRTDSGRLLVQPNEMIMLSSETWPPPVASCEMIGGHRAYVSFPACGLIAEIDLDTGRVLQSVRITKNGVQDVGTDPVCPGQCTDHWGDGVVGGVLNEERPAHLAYRSFLASGSSPVLFVAPHNGDYVAAIEIAPDGTFRVADHRIIVLEGVEKGIRRIRLSPLSDPPHDWQFLYVMTRDGDIRVIDTMADPEVECETNPDPRDPLFEEDAGWRESYAGCIPIGEVNRDPLMETPGIDIPGFRQVMDVAFTFVDATALEDELDALEPVRLDGLFAYAVTMDGVSFLINIDEKFESVDDNENGISDHLEHRLEDGIHAVMAHQLRNVTDTRSDEDGRPRFEEPFTYLSEGSESSDPPAGITIADYTIDNGRGAVNETWTLVYEDVLPGGARTTGYIFKPNPAVDDPESAELRDSGSAFCSTGVKAGDVVVIAGCETDADCADGFVCLENPRKNQDNGGVCVDERYAGEESLIRSCLPLAQATREYEVLEAYNEALILGVLPAPGTPCQNVADCEIDGPQGLSYVCEEGQCVVDCSELGPDDRPLVDCAEVAGVCVEGRCLKAPLPDRRVDLSGEVTWCIPALFDYEIRAGSTFALSGSESGYFVARKPDPELDLRCVDDESLSPLYKFRVEPSVEPFSNPIFTLTLESTARADELTREDGIRFELISGFNPAFFDLTCRLPATAVVGVDGYVYIVDMGNDVETAGGVDGQIVRVNPAEIYVDADFLIR